MCLILRILKIKCIPEKNVTEFFFFCKALLVMFAWLSRGPLHTHFYSTDLKVANAIRFLLIATMHLMIVIMMVLIVTTLTLYLHFTIVNNKLKM